MTDGGRLIAVCGATGRQGGAVTRSLLKQGWRVRALTRRPNQEGTLDLAAMGAEVAAADMEDLASLRRAFDGADGVFSVQNGLASGFDRELTQGKNVADAAKESGVAHVVYASAGPGQTGTGVPSWESKLQVEDHMRKLRLPFTSLRPQAFMELMTDKGYYPAVGTWRIFPRLTGEHRPIPWLAVEDVGPIAVAVFADPDEYVDRSLVLLSDVKSLAECRALHREVMGRDPASFPMPIWLFDRFTRRDVTTMWRWLRTGSTEDDPSPTRAIHPDALTVREWFSKARQVERERKDEE